MKTLKTFFVVSSIFLFSGAFAQEKYNIDPVHSSVGFSVKHMVISNVKGNFGDFKGVILFDEKDVAKSSVEAEISVKSIDTDNTDRDNHLKGADFFDAEKFPQITFKSKKIVKKGKGYEAHGTLTVRGVSKEVAFPFTFLGKAKDLWGGTRIGFEGSLTINRQDFGMAFNTKLDTGGLLVGNDIEVELNIEAIKEELKK